MVSNTFGQQVRTIRTLRQMTQGELAAVAGLSRQAVNMIETGASNPQPTTVEALKRALNWSPDADSLFAQMLDLANVVSST